jgi:hypothetical protein
MVVTIGQGEKLGPLERTARAFYLESSEVMRGDIVRALVEYITNSDDAYQRKGGKGKIVVEVEHKRGSEPWRVWIRDRATGMSLAELRDKIARQGGRTSGHEEGKSVRGNRGLGAKDPAIFGKVTFSSVKDGDFAWMEIDDLGEVEAIKKPMKATKEIREALGISGNHSGTVVMITVTHALPAPRHENLKRILQDHLQLRDIVQDPDREISLRHASQPGSKPETLRYEPPKLSQRIHEQGLKVPGYPEATVDLDILESEQAFPEMGRRNPLRRSGLLIKGAHAVYEATLFGFESHPHALAFTGQVRCPYIDALARDFDDRLEKGLPRPASNPQPIISRARSGLVEEHPFYQALRRVVEERLGPLVEERQRRAQERTRAVENAKTTKLLAQLAKEGAKFMEEASDEEDFEIPPLGVGEEAPPLGIIPGALELAAGAQRTLTVMAARAGLDGDTAEVVLELAPAGIVTASAEVLTLRPNRRREDVLSATIKVTAGAAPGATLLKASLGDRYRDCYIEVLEPETPPEPVAPDDLTFEKPRYRVTRGKVRVLTVLAPLQSYVDGTRLKVTSNYRGVVVLDGGLVPMHHRPEQLAMIGSIRVEGRSESTKAAVTVTDPRGYTASTEVSVAAHEEGGAGFEIKLVDQVRGDQRAQWNADYTKLEIMGEHPAVRPYLGPADDGYPGQNTVQYEVLQAELVGDAIVRRILQQKFGEDEVDVLTLYVLHNRFISKFMARAHKIIAAGR